MSETQVSKNTDVEIYRRPSKDGLSEYYEPSIHVTKDGAIGINLAGHVIVMPIEKWFAAAEALHQPNN